MSEAQAAGNVSDDQANEALQQLLNEAKGEESEQQEKEAEAEPEVVLDQEKEAAPAQEETPEPTDETLSDDMESLKARISELEEQRKQSEEAYNARLAAQQKRYSENEQILRNRMLQKSTVADRARQILEKSRTDDGVPDAEVEAVLRELQGTMHPSSASYEPPQQDGAAATEDQALILNAFLNDRGLSTEEADKFGNWIRTEASTAMSPLEQSVAENNLMGFLIIAHDRWQQGVREKEKETNRADAADAVKTVQRTQKAAARAASTSAAGPKKTAAGPSGVDLRKITPDDVSALLRASVEEHK